MIIKDFVMNIKQIISRKSKIGLINIKGKIIMIINIML